MIMAEDPPIRDAVVSHKSPMAPVRIARVRTNSVWARDIKEEDFDATADLLQEGFPAKSKLEFLAALVKLSGRVPIQEPQPIGCVLTFHGKIVGVLLTIISRIHDKYGSYLRCNVGCWYVKPAFRLYAPLLVMRSQRGSQMTHLNVWPARHTWETIRVQGFTPVSSGTFAGVPALSGLGVRARVYALKPGSQIPDVLPAAEARVLLDHVDFGCLCLLVEAEGEMTPFIFQRRYFRRARLPGAQLIYCRSLADLTRLSGPIGRYLAARGLFWVFAGANERIPGIPGVFLRDKLPIYARGLHRPREGDLTYTEAAMFGF